MSGEDSPPIRPILSRSGRYEHPWDVEGGTSRGLPQLMRWQWDRLRNGVEPHPPRRRFPMATPDLTAKLASGQIRLTWVGHATYLIETASVAILTDPVWSERASPFSRVGPRRLVSAALAFDALPRIDVVVISHDHYDHLDASTVRRLNDRFPDLTWVTPLGYAPWLRRRGARLIAELDWWDSAHPVLPATAEPVRVTAVPAQHWTRRTMFDTRVRLWAAFALDLGSAGRLYFGGDSGYFTAVTSIGDRLGPFDVSLLPIGAYEPRWFMRSAHMNPDEAVRTYLDIGGTGLFAPMHWGTFRLTDEPAFEPPAALRAAWERHGLPLDDLWVPVHGESRVLSR